MNEFPNFMKPPVNLIGKDSQYTDEVEGYVFNGADGSYQNIITIGLMRF